MLRLCTFFQNRFPSICSAGGKSAILTLLPNGCRPKSENLSLRSWNSWRIEKQILTPKFFPRKCPLARRVQFWKDCLRKFSEKWSWINQDTIKKNKTCTFSKKILTGKSSLDTQEQFRQLWRSFPAGIQEIFQSKSGIGRTILILCRKEISSNHSSRYVECRIDKTDKIAFFECSKMHRSKSVNEKKMVSVKKRTLFLQNVSVNTWIAIFFKLAKSCRKTCEQDLLQIRTWEKSTFSKSSFFRNHAHLYNRNECLEHLEKTFLPIIRKKLLHKPEKDMIFP